ncbi:hypothetical protein CR513_31239, partial [Mucuna pruriens]
MTDPSTFAQASNDPYWIAAMDAELTALEANNWIESLADLMKLFLDSSHDQAVDIFSKVLHPSPFQWLVSKLEVVDIYHPPACNGRKFHTQILTEDRVIF